MQGLYQIRCYGKYYDPDEFKTRGWRGWWVGVLNRARYWLECKVVFHVLKIKAQPLGNDLVDMSAVIDRFEQDAKQERMHFKQQRPRMVLSTNASLDGHLRNLHKPNSVENPRDVTARIMDRYAADPRTKRYAFGRNRRMVMEAESTIQEIQTHGEETKSVQPINGREKSRQATGRVRSTIPPEYAEEDFSGFVGDIEDGTTHEPDDPSLVAERLGSTSERAREAAAAATEHQRSVLSEERTQRADGHAGSGPDAGSEVGPHVPGEETGERGGTEGRSGEIRAEGT